MQYRFPVLFLFIYLLLQFGYQVAPEWLIKDIIVEKATVAPGAFFIDSLWPELNVSAEGTRIVSSNGSINVLRGCEGTETLLLLFAALLASFSIGKNLRSIVIGLLLGSIIIYIVNQVRIAALFRIVVDYRSSFELAHGYIAPLFVIGVATTFFILWLKLTQRTR